MMQEDQTAEFRVSVQVMSGPTFHLSIDTPLGECAAQGPTPELAALGLVPYIALAIENTPGSR